MQKDDAIRLQHMLDAGREALLFIADKSRGGLDNNRMLVLSLIKDIEIIGEAANKVSLDVKNKYINIPWLDIIGMRHHLIHGYFDIDLNIVWDTVTKDIPPLIIEIERILKEKDKP
ncbi:MAG: DUF86 domain-containing protein [Deltaproteobacteria bacterium]|nr:DUF86 domain-containing protein [Deltaproteobacteria bacterium]